MNVHCESHAVEVCCVSTTACNDLRLDDDAIEFETSENEIDLT